jgi:MFS family permease
VWGVGYLRLLRRPPILVLWSSTALSVLGDRLYGLAVMWVVYATTGSASLMGLVAVVESIPYIVLGSVGRTVIARFASYRALAWIDGGRAVVAFAVPVLWSPDVAGFVVLLALVFLLGSLGVLFDPNLDALVPDLVEPHEVRQVTALLDLTVRVAAIAGPGSVGALLLIISDVQLFAADAATFVVSALALGWLGRHATRRVRIGEVRPRLTASVRAWPLLRQHPRVGLAIGVHGVALCVAAVSAVGLPALLATRLGQGAGGYGLVLAAIGAGALVGNLLIGHLAVEPWLWMYCGTWAVSGLTLVGMGTAASFPVVAGFAFAAGLVTPATSVSLRAHLGRFPSSERLRLMTVDQTTIRSAGTFGMLVFPFVVDASPRGAFTAAGVIVIAAASAALLAGARLQPDASPALVPTGPGEMAARHSVAAASSQ